MTNVEWRGRPVWNALLISAGAYRHHPTLRTSAAAARQVEAVLADPQVCGFAKIDRIEDPTADQARQAVLDFLERHGDGPMLLYFTGQGKYDFASGRLHLLTVDSPAHVQEYGGGSVTDDWLVRELAMVRSDGVFVVLDTRFASAALTEVWQAPKEVPYALTFRTMVQGNGFCTLAAASPVEPADLTGGELSPLTQALVEVLRDGSAADETGWTSVGRLCEQVCQRVVASGSGQSPTSSARPRGKELYLARRPPDLPDLEAIRQALGRRDYGTVRRLLRPVKDSDNGEYRYYTVLGMFGGHPPREFATDDVQRAEEHLAGASTFPAQLCALWALIREDHYSHRGLDPGPPTVEELIQRAREIDPLYAAEIVTHMPVPECQTWARLRNRASAALSGQSSGV